MNPCALSGSEHRLAVFQTGHEGLLAEDVLACGGCHLSELGVFGVLGADNHRLHLRSQQRLVAVKQRHAVLFCLRLRPLAVMVGNPHKLRTRVRFQAVRVAIGVQVRETHDAHFDLHRLTTLPVRADSIAINAMRTASTPSVTVSSGVAPVL